MFGRGRRDRPPTGDDRELIGRLLAGDREAEADFEKRFRGLAIGLARGRFKLDHVAAHEVWQDVVLKLWASDRKALRNWRGEGRFSTYLTIVVVNECLRRQAAQGRQAATDEPLEAASRVADGELSPSERSLRRERQQAIAEAMDALSARDRLLLRLRFQDGYEPTEMAALLRKTPGAVRKALHDARRRLRKQLLASHPELFSEPTGNADAAQRSPSSRDRG